ncbi:hypothetical protein AAG906_036311 [Vitis piasezkii]
MADRTLTVNWYGLEEDEDDDHFFESFDRISSAVPLDLASSDDDDDEFDDTRMSFASAISSVPTQEFRAFAAAAAAAATAAPPASETSSSDDYGMWMAEPGSIQERRKRLLQGMGLTSEKEFIRLASVGFKRAASTKVGNCEVTPIAVDTCSTEEEAKPQLVPVVHVRSRSDGDMEAFSANTKHRKKQLLGEIKKLCLTRTSSSLSTPCPRIGQYDNSITVSEKEAEGGCSVRSGDPLSTMVSKSRFGAFFLIKNLDTGKEFIVKEFDEDGMWNRLSDLQTGKQLTMEEFEKSVGYSPVVKELMRRQNVVRITDGIGIGGSERKPSMNSYITKSFRFSKRRGVALLKNIKGVANSFISEREREIPSLQEAKSSKNSSSEWIKVRQHGKSYKELTALHLCQEIQAHEGSIWTIRFSSDGRYLASAGEDRIIHVWEVQECEATPWKPPDELNSTPLHPMALGSSDRPPLPETPISAERKKKGKMSSSSRKGHSIPDYIHMPETVFSLLEIPVCSFKGHLDDVLDLSWSGSQLLLSSSMDKTVRLWDMETKSCLKLFAHNDYVTCIQFNPMDDKYFISGSLDAKVRIWSIPDRQVVDWTDLHEMVTAASYTPDGQGALIGLHQGSCRMYSIDDGKLNQTGQIDIQNKKKSQTKKITGFQFAPGNPSEVLITSADSRIRIFDGSDIIHKFRGIFPKHHHLLVH